MAVAFDRSEQDITLAVTAYIIFQAITPSFIAPLSDTHGRRPVIIGVLTVYIAANIGVALLPTDQGGYVGLLILRAVQVSVQTISIAC